MNILTNDPLTQAEINAKIALSKLSTALKVVSLMSASGLITALLSSAMTRGLSGLIGGDTKEADEFTLYLAFISIAVFILSSCFHGLVDYLIKYDKSDLMPISGEHLEKMLLHCQKHAVIDSYRNKVVSQGRVFYLFELKAANDFEAYLRQKQSRDKLDDEYKLAHNKLYSKQ